MMKYMPGNEDKVLKLIENEYNRFFPDNPFDHFFLEDYYDQQYRDEKLLGKMLLLAPRLAQELGLDTGFKTLINTGRGGGQEVFHIHVHVFGGGDPVPKL